MKIRHTNRGPAVAALHALHSAASPTELTVEDLERQRKGQALLGRLITPMRGMEWTPLTIGTVPAAWTAAEHGGRQSPIILYCHGGGYTSGNLGYARPLAAKFVHATGCRVLAFEYRLAPEHPYPAALDDALLIWDYLMQLGYGAREVIVAGDSAGGNLALALTLKLREQARLLPRALVLLSPWTDMTCSGCSYEERAALDPILDANYISATRHAYAPHGGDFSDPFLSPLFGSLADFPPTLIQVGELEILHSDSVRLRDRMTAAGTLCRLEVWRDMWHVFQMFPIPKADRAMERIAQFLTAFD